ncbi:hypothetical protein JTE90_001003 [Oedothorax gibbosus]|uniref:Uncharacterized protein n=1 Tax=Oedothorax gibbosus TaxID=931172 RepID=A0AAV6TRS8_9ARAC|nr:hypothetical protein JTE90_001003 [Oedothorax gibbosus]
MRRRIGDCNSRDGESKHQGLMDIIPRPRRPPSTQETPGTKTRREERAQEDTPKDTHAAQGNKHNRPTTQPAPQKKGQEHPGA